MSNVCDFLHNSRDFDLENMVNFFYQTPTFIISTERHKRNSSQHSPLSSQCESFYR